MLRLRKAIPSDLKQILALAEKWNTEWLSKTDVAFDRKHVAQKLCEYVALPKHAIFVAVEVEADKDNRICGEITGKLVSSLWSPETYGFCVSWLSKGRTAIRLLKQFEQWCDTQGAAGIYMSALAVCQLDMMNRLYPRLGYTHVDSNYFMRL